tara:strand:- start:725 stop:913 length:189 start_codon:yes stop_codon:yes gene_type:complete
MEEKRLKVDFLLVFWVLLILLNLAALSASWYADDLTNYRYSAIMLIYCIGGAYFSLPKDKEK